MHLVSYGSNLSFKGLMFPLQHLYDCNAATQFLWYRVLLGNDTTFDLFSISVKLVYFVSSC